MYSYIEVMKMSFGNRVLDALVMRGMSREELYARTDLKSSYLVGYIKNPNRSPTLSTACKIALALDVSLDYLAGLIDEPHPIERDENGNIVLSESLLQRQLGDGFSKLNDEGQMKAVDYVRDLTELERYTDRAKNEASDAAGA